MEAINFKYHSADNGNCRVYYKANKRLYCWQLVTKDAFELLSCSRDGEPSCPIKPEYIGQTELPKGGEAIERELANFLRENQQHG